MAKKPQNHPNTSKQKPAVQTVQDFQGQSPAVLAKPEENYGDSETLIKAKHNQGNRFIQRNKAQALLHLKQ